MPFTPARAPAAVDKGKKSTYTNASEITTARSVNAISSFVSTNNVVGSAKKAMQAAKGGNYVLASTMSSATNGSRVKIVTYPIPGAGGTFIEQYSSSGDVNWVARILNGSGVRISTDSNGNINVTGVFSATVTFYNKNDIAFGTTLTSVSGNDVFVAQYSSTGSVNWAAKLGGIGAGPLYVDTVTNMCTDSSGNINVTGHTDSSPIRFYDKNGTEFSRSFSYTGGYYDIYLAQYSSTGSVNWVAQIAGGIEFDSDVCVDSSGNITITGLMNSANPLTLYNKDGTSGRTVFNIQNSDGFIGQYNSSGFVNWAARLGGDGGDGDGQRQRVFADLNGNINLVAFSSSYTLTIYDKNNSAAASITDYGQFIAQYTSAGLLNWVASGLPNVQCICTDSNGNINMAGSAGGGDTFSIKNKNGVAFTRTIPNFLPGGSGSYIAQFTSAGLVNWVSRIAGGAGGTIISICTDSSGNINVTGNFNSNPLLFYNKDGVAFSKTLGMGVNNSFTAQYTSTGFVNWLAQVGAGASSSSVFTDSNKNVNIIGGYSSGTEYKPPLVINASV